MTRLEFVRGQWIKAKRSNRHWTLWHYIPDGSTTSLCGRFDPAYHHGRRIQHDHEQEGDECRKCLEQLRWQLSRHDYHRSLYRRAARSAS